MKFKNQLASMMNLRSLLKKSMLLLLMHTKTKILSILFMLLKEKLYIWLMNIYTFSYILVDTGVILVVSFFIETPFRTLRITLEKMGLSCHLHKTTFHVYMIHLFGSLMMI
jgi:hypothetical protein